MIAEPGTLVHLPAGTMHWFRYGKGGGEMISMTLGDPMPVYIVEFTPPELWGPRAEPGAQTLYAELFEAYLEEPA